MRDGVQLDVQKVCIMAQSDKIRRYSQELRKNMTKEERHLWYDFLKPYPIPIHRQYSFGEYIVDFYCHKAKLVIELDGSQHCEPEKEEYDRKRTEYLEKRDCMLCGYPTGMLRSSSGQYVKLWTIRFDAEWQSK